MLENTGKMNYAEYGTFKPTLQATETKTHASKRKTLINNNFLVNP